MYTERFESITPPKPFSIGAKSFKSNSLSLYKHSFIWQQMNIQWIRGQFYSDRRGTVDTGYVATIQRGVASKDKCQFGRGEWVYNHNYPEKSDKCIRYVYVADTISILTEHGGILTVVFVGSTILQCFCAGAGTFEHLLARQPHSHVFCFDKNTVWMNYNTSVPRLQKWTLPGTQKASASDLPFFY